MTDPMHRSEIKPAETRGPWKWHIEEVFKGLVTLGVESLKIMALINGGAAVAILAYLGNIASRVLVQILLSVCFCRVNDFPEFRLPRPWPTFPEWWLLFRLVV
jgi:hypothetical protein